MVLSLVLLVDFNINVYLLRVSDGCYMELESYVWTNLRVKIIRTMF